MRFFNFGKSLNQKTLRGKMKESAPNLLTPYGIHCQTILRNASPAIYEEALLHETDSVVSDTGALKVSSSEKQEEALKTSESLPLLNSSMTYGGAMSISGSMKTLF